MIDQNSFELLRMQIEKISYNSFDSIAVMPKSIVKDSVSAMFIDEGYIKLNAKREISFNPKTLFEIIVEMSMILKVKQGFLNEIKGINLNKYFENEQVYTGYLYNKISLIVCEITDASTGMALTLPPSRQKENI